MDKVTETGKKGRKEEQEQKEEQPALTLPSSVHIALKLVFGLLGEDLLKQNESLCNRILQTIEDLFSSLPCSSMGTEDPEVLDSILKALEGFLKHDDGVQTDIVYTALLSLAVARGELGFNFRIIRTLLEGKGDVGVSSNFLSLLNYLTTFSGGVVPRSAVEMKVSKDSFDENVDWEIRLPNAQPSSIATNGAYLFVHNKDGLFKIGTGFQGTEKGKVYQHVQDFYNSHIGWLACSEGSLYFRNQSMDPGLFLVVDADNLEKVNLLVQTEGTGELCEKHNIIFNGKEIGSVEGSSKTSTIHLHMFKSEEGRLIPKSFDNNKSIELKWTSPSSRKVLWSGTPPDWGIFKGENLHIIPKLESVGVITRLTCEDSTLVILNDAGELFYCGSGFGLGLKENSATPIQLEVPNTVVDFAHSGDHLLVIDSNGHLYTAGDPAEGKLGLPVDKDSSLQPLTKIDLFGPSTERAVSVSVNLGRSAVVTSDGNLYTFGAGVASGHEKPGEDGEEEADDDDASYEDEITVPTKVSAFDAYEVVGVSLGGNHSCVITGQSLEERALWAMGSNHYGQCGKEGRKVYSKPVKIEFPTDVPVDQVVCGCQHTIVLLHDGSLYTFGGNSEGALGLGDNDDRYVPTLVTLPGGVKAKSIYAGDNASVVLGENGVIYAAGDCGLLGTNSSQSTFKAIPLNPLISVVTAYSGRESSVIVGDFEPLLRGHSLSDCTIVADDKTIGFIVPPVDLPSIALTVENDEDTADEKDDEQEKDGEQQEKQADRKGDADKELDNSKDEEEEKEPEESAATEPEDEHDVSAEAQEDELDDNEDEVDYEDEEADSSDEEEKRNKMDEQNNEGNKVSKGESAEETEKKPVSPEAVHHFTTKNYLFRVFDIVTGKHLVDSEFQKT
eukprot:TRINITY_DN5830_c0_g6_i1.p1 TRINITY_DN5830_c0_g6~~TRINITY_DN5830_c0_g6_i1.p1  ORF type:complete len:1023 (-),score=205.49 TRINITY_DN5830_c0_g6_i1:527-3211(-)